MIIQVRTAIAVFILATAFMPLGAQSPDATLNRAVDAYAKVKTVRANFTQELSNPLTGTSVMSRGEVMQERPRLMSVRFTDPAGDRIIADGKSLWIYLPSTNPGQVIRTAIGKNGEGAPDVTAQFLNAPKTRYSVSDAGRGDVSGRPARKLTLVARDSSVPFKRAVIWVDDADGLVRKFEMTDGNDVVRKITITNLAINVPIAKSSFNFKPPKGVKVFEQR